VIRGVFNAEGVAYGVPNWREYFWCKSNSRLRWI